MGKILEKAGFRFSLGRSLFLGSVMLLVVEKKEVEIVSLNKANHGQEN